MIQIELYDMDPASLFEGVTVDMLPDRLQPYVVPGTRRLVRIKHEIEAGVVTQVWERWVAVNVRDIKLHRFTLRFPESEL